MKNLKVFCNSWFSMSISAKLDHIDHTGPYRAKLDQTGPNWTRSSRIGPYRADCDDIGQTWTEPGRTGPDRAERDDIGPTWTRSGRTGPDQAERDDIRPHWTETLFLTNCRPLGHPPSIGAPPLPAVAWAWPPVGRAGKADLSFPAAGLDASEEYVSSSSADEFIPSSTSK